MSNSAPLLVWARKGKAIRGIGPIQWVDPGVGPGRYQRALGALQHSKATVAIASFTFDPDEPGSVVAIPESIGELTLAEATRSKSSVGHIVDDGQMAWSVGWRKAIDAVASDVVEKVVLTRQLDLEFNDVIDTESAVGRLLASQPDCFTFAIDGLVGSSPELLVSLDSGRVTSLALAGTAARTSELRSEKMDREHALSLASVELGMAPHLRSLDIAPRTAMSFGDINHLATRFTGQVNNGTTVLDILATLHPTAAVAGTPTDTSLKIIKDIEKRPRGRYAGPVGWFNRTGDGEFAIALRCGVIRGRKATLFAGGGIVAGSVEPSELAETDLKLQPMLAALGLR